jgi:hypothetical protein
MAGRDEQQSHRPIEERRMSREREKHLESGSVGVISSSDDRAAVYSCEVLVIGSGVSGYCAAIQAGREGCRTILLEKDEVLGGNSGPNLGVGITGADRYHTFATEGGLIQELQEEAAWVRGFTQVSPGMMPYNISRRNEAVVQSALEAAV